MAIIKTFFAGIENTFKTGSTSVNSLNVCPTTQVATAAGATISAQLFNDYEFFNVDQTSADTDIILIPENLPVGTQVYVHALDVAELRVSGSDTFNSEASSTEYALVADTLTRAIKVSATAWIVNNFAAVGTESAANPD